MKSKHLGNFIVCIFAIFSLSGNVLAGPVPKGLTLSPQKVSINAFFSGETLKISGRIPASQDVMIEITGKDTESAFDLKGRIGPFWMTKGNVTLKHVPELYLLLLPQSKEVEKEVQDQGLGMARLEKKLSADGSVQVPGDIFRLFSTLKEEEGLYRKAEGAVVYSDERDGTKAFTAVYKLPALINPGTYQVIATAMDKSGVKDRMKASLQVSQEGFVKLVDHLASDRRIAYGVTAVVIALFAGIVMGIVFKQSGGAH